MPAFIGTGQSIWPTLPHWLKPAPFYIAWEVLRIGVHMGIDLHSPLKLDQPHRLGRKYGADRFLELLVPSPDSSNLPSFIKDKPFYDELVNWLTQEPHVFYEIWIETYPSQRKWELKATDPEHRTLEIRSSVPEKLRSASLNLQFLPVLEDRAIDKQKMREIMSNLLEDNLRQQLGEQRESLESPIQFQKWISANSTHRSERFVRGHVPFQGGLPREDEEIMALMLNAGFDPWRNKFLNEMAYNAQFRLCEKLSKKLNIKIGCSAYLFMVVDFSHELEEGEVHIAFSDRFKAEVGDWEGTMVHSRDVLVARSPAHFPSDIQRVRAVFKPELAHLQNVIVFSAKGNTPLAEKLSGGDYDGDQCLCVWDDRLVSNFANDNDEAQPDLRNYYRQDRIQLRQLLSTHNGEYRAAMKEMIEKCFAFNLTKDLLGQATNYKERLCYSRGNVHDEVARKLSTLLSTLVDAPKQGIEFDAKDFKAFKQSLELPDHVEEPLYKKDRQPPDQHYGHILDHLKFAVAQPTIEEELSSFYTKEKLAKVGHWDKDLTSRHYDEWQDDGGGSAQTILRCLKRDIGQVLEEWNSLSNDDSVSFSEMVQRTYNSWQGIQPSKDVPEETLRRLRRSYAQTSEWALLKASTTFKLYYQLKPRFVWQLAGWHLCFIKWLAVSEMPALVGRMPAVLTSSMYTITKVDSRTVNHLIELQTGLGIEGNGSGDEEEDDA
ncbi:hypothetical protein SLS64_009312 [Diaporthe eres]